jgi:hypothetical protein
MKNEQVAEPKNQQRETSTRKTNQHEIDFEGIHEDALNRFNDVIEWLELEGKQEGNYYVAFNPRLGSFKINSETGQWEDFAVEGASGSDLISLVAYLNGMSQDQAALELQFFLAELDYQYQEQLVQGQVAARHCNEPHLSDGAEE